MAKRRNTRRRVSKKNNMTKKRKTRRIRRKMRGGGEGFAYIKSKDPGEKVIVFQAEFSSFALSQLEDGHIVEKLTLDEYNRRQLPKNKIDSLKFNSPSYSGLTLVVWGGSPGIPSIPNEGLIETRHLIDITRSDITPDDIGKNISDLTSLPVPFTQTVVFQPPAEGGPSIYDGISCGSDEDCIGSDIGPYCVKEKCSEDAGVLHRGHRHGLEREGEQRYVTLDDILHHAEDIKAKLSLIWDTFNKAILKDPTDAPMASAWLRTELNALEEESSRLRAYTDARKRAWARLRE